MKLERLFHMNPMFEDLDAKVISLLKDEVEVVAVESGQLLCRAGQPADDIIYLARGRISIQQRSSRRNKPAFLVGIIEGPAIFGDMEWSMGSPWANTVRAIEDGWCVHIPIETWERLLQENHDLAIALYRDASRRHFLANQTAESAATLPVEGQVLRILADAEDIELSDDDFCVSRPTTQVELAAWLGLNRRTVARALSALKSMGLLESRAQNRFAIRLDSVGEEHLPAHLMGLTSSSAEMKGPLLDAIGAELPAPEEPSLKGAA